MHARLLCMRNNSFWSVYNNSFIMSNVFVLRWRARQGVGRTKIRLSCQRSYDPSAQVPSIYRICARLGSYYVSVPLKSLPRSGPFVWGIVAMMPCRSRAFAGTTSSSKVHPPRESLLRCQVSPRETRVRRGSRMREYIPFCPISCTLAVNLEIMVERFNYQLEKLMKANLANHYF